MFGVCGREIECRRLREEIATVHHLVAEAEDARARLSLEQH
jgi:hypothetical protein